MARPKRHAKHHVISYNARLGLFLFAIYLVFYGGFVALNSFDPKRMGEPFLAEDEMDHRAQEQCVNDDRAQGGDGAYRQWSQERDSLSLHQVGDLRGVRLMRGTTPDRSVVNSEVRRARPPRTRSSTAANRLTLARPLAGGAWRSYPIDVRASGYRSCPAAI